MRFKLTFTAIFIMIAVKLFGQTEEQKQIMYEQVNQDSRGSGKIVSRIDPIENKEILFKNATVFPVYRIEFVKNKKLTLVQNKNYFFVLYVGRLYVFLNNKSYRLFENSPIIKKILNLSDSKKKFVLSYLTDNFSYTGKFLNPIITDNNLSFVFNNEKEFLNIYEYIDFKYGSFEKYQEKSKLDSLRDHLNANIVLQSIKNNYKSYQYNCPKDTTLVIKKFIDWVNQATGGITKSQEFRLIEQIRIKINPVKYLFDKGNNSKIKDSTFNSQFKIALKENEDLNKKIIKFNGNYDLFIYGANITNDLLDVLTNKQFINYKNFTDALYPICDANNVFNSERYYYYKDVLEKESFFKSTNPNDKSKEFNEYQKKILTECGCPFDETVKREMIIR